MNKHFPKRLLAGWLCLLMLLSAFPAAFLATAEGEEAATSGYKVLQAMADDQTLPYTAASNWYRFRNTNLMLNQEVQAKFAAGEDNDLALYLNLYIDNKSNPGNLGTLTTTKPGNDRRIVLQSFDGKAYYEVVWFYPQMALKAGWNKLLLAFSTTKCEAAGAKLAQKNTITAAQTAARQTFDINFAGLGEDEQDYDIRLSNVALVDTSYDADGNLLKIIDPEAPAFKKLQDVADNRDFVYDAANKRFLTNAKVTYNSAVKSTSLDDLALYMDVYIDNANDPAYLNLFADTGDGQLALQYYDSVNNAYHEVRWRAKEQFAKVNWKKGWNRVLLGFSNTPNNSEVLAPFGIKDPLWDVEQSFQFRLNSLATDKDYTGFKIRLANICLVDTSYDAEHPEVGTMQEPEYRAVAVLNDRTAHLTASGTTYTVQKSGLSVDTSAMKKENLEIFANVYLPQASAVQSATVSLTTTDGKTLSWTPTGLKDGWNALALKLTNASPADAAVAGVSVFTLTVTSATAQDVRLGTAWLVNNLSSFSDTTLTFSNVFGDHMLFQRNKPINIWGKAARGDTVTATLTETASGKVAATATATAAQDDTFTVTLPAMEGSYTAYTLTIEDKDAIAVKATKTFTDVVIGELWVASGQSNMELTVERDRNATTILAQAAEAQNTNIRYLKERSWPYGDNVEHPLTPNFDIIDTYWGTAADTAKLKNVSSIGYQFAVQLQAELDMPVGIVSNASGGSRIDCWLSREAIDGDADVKALLQSRKEYYDDTNWPTANNRMSTLYNEIIGPLAGWEDGKGMQITGTLWYQGEASLAMNGNYDKLLELLQKDWSRTFGFTNEEMPLIYAHIAPHIYGAYISDQAQDMSRAWNAHQSSMAQVTLYDLPLTYQNGDGSLNSVIHPTTKTPAANRFYQAALDLQYGGTADATAPVYKSMTVLPTGRIRVTFDKVGSGLTVIGGGTDLHGFTIAGADGVFVNAKAEIVAPDTVEVWNERVTSPQNVTYAYGNYVMASNLANSAGFPAAAFQTTKTGSFMEPQDWMMADGKVWVRYATTRELADFRDLWKVADGDAIFSYDTAVKAEGAASLKLTYQSNTAAVTPIWGDTIDGKEVTFDGIRRKTFDKSQYLTVSVSNPDDRAKQLQLIVVSGGKSYTASVAGSTETTALLPASSGFASYAFQLQKLQDENGKTVTNAAALLQNLTELRFSVNDTQGGTVYLDDVQLGMTDDTLTAPQLGDIDQNGAVTASDALLALQQATGATRLSGTALTLADVDGDGTVTVVDALTILHFAAGKITRFPAEFA